MGISMFQDKTYEGMDDISKLVEPIESLINNELSQFPDEIEITQADILSIYSGSWGWSSLNLVSIVENKARELKLKQLYDSGDIWSFSSKFFKFEVRDLEEGDVVKINFKENTLSHRLFLVKHTIGYTETELEAMAKKNLTAIILNRLWSNKAVNKPRLNELADLFGAEEVKSDRSYRGKVKKFCNHINNLVDDKKLEIKDLELCRKFAEWIVLYVKDGNLAALNNVTRIKIMMHEDRPIYSIEERSVK